MAKVGRATAAIHRHTPSSSVSFKSGTRRGGRGGGELEDSVISVASPPRGHGRRASRASNRVPQIIVESGGGQHGHGEESLYPSLTTLASLEDEEDEFSCKDCCKSGEVENDYGQNSP